MILSGPLSYFQTLLGKHPNDVPSVLQFEFIECGAASLSMILRNINALFLYSFYEKIVVLVEMVVLCSQSRKLHFCMGVLPKLTEFH